MSEQIRAFIDRLKEKAIGSGVGGLTLILNDTLYENVSFIHKYLGYLRQAKDMVVPMSYSLIGMVMNLPGADESLSIGIASGLKGVFDAFVFKKPFAYAKDASTIEVFNLDANETITVIIDGSEVSFSTEPTTDANGNATIKLPSALSSGKHDLIVRTSKKAFYGAIVV